MQYSVGKEKNLGNIYDKLRHIENDLGELSKLHDSQTSASGIKPLGNFSELGSEKFQ